jgi:hypothetical protein
LERLVEEINDDATIASFDAEACCQYLDNILTCFGEEVNVHTLQGLLDLFLTLSKATKVWEFFHSRPFYVASNGTGYSQNFHDKLENFFEDIGGQDKVILETFSSVAHWICILIGNRSTTFIKLIEALLNSPRIAANLESHATGNRFSQLLVAEEYMDYIAGLFQNGLSSLDSVLSQLKMMQSTNDGTKYTFDLANNKLSVEYVDSKKNCKVFMNDEQLTDFLQRLGFVQREEKAF